MSAARYILEFLLSFLSRENYKAIVRDAYFASFGSFKFELFSKQRTFDKLKKIPRRYILEPYLPSEEKKNRRRQKTSVRYKKGVSRHFL